MESAGWSQNSAFQAKCPWVFVYYHCQALKGFSCTLTSCFLKSLSYWIHLLWGKERTIEQLQRKDAKEAGFFLPFFFLLSSFFLGHIPSQMSLFLPYFIFNYDCNDFNGSDCSYFSYLKLAVSARLAGYGVPRLCLSLLHNTDVKSL